MKIETDDIETYIREQEAAGRLDPDCPGCEDTYKALRENHDWPFGPNHRATSSCQSGGRPHCTCDTCF